MAPSAGPPRASELAVQQSVEAAEKVRPIGLTFSDTTLPATASSFDVVYSSHVLEHLPNPLASLQEQLRQTKEGGFVIAHTPSGCEACPWATAN